MKRPKLIIILFTVLLVCATVASSQNKSGTYNRKDKWGFGQLVITSGKTSLSFRLNVGRIGKSMFERCVGEIQGKAKWISENIAEYNGDFNERKSDGEAVGCRLTFIFSGNTITIREGDCNDYHGAMCNFEGKYSRPAPIKHKIPIRKLPQTNK